MTQPNHAERAHATLGASGAYRWMACPGSVRLTAGRHSKSGPAARRGTAAHQLAEQCLSDNTPARQHIGEIVTVEDEQIELTAELCGAVQLYLDTLRADHQDGDELQIEQRLDLSSIHPECFGTADAVRYRRSTAHMVVYDFKAGLHAVEVGDNPQLKFYALGSLLVDIFRPVHRVTLKIIQPLAHHPSGPVRSFDLTGQELNRWAFTLRAAARATDQPDAPLVAGPHCQWCLAAPTCPEKKVSAGRAAADLFDAEPA